MQNPNSIASNKEIEVGALNGWLMLAVNVALLSFGAYLIGDAIY